MDIMKMRYSIKPRDVKDHDFYLLLKILKKK